MEVPVTSKRLVLLAFALCMITLPSAADTIRVPADQPTIQAGIDAAADGDTVIVSTGIYPESVNFRGQAIEVRSLNGAESTTIVGEVNFVNDEDDRSILDGFTVRDNPENDSGIHIYRSSPVVRNNIIRDHSYCGFQITGSFCSPLILNNIIRDNRSPFSGGGIFMSFADPKIVGNTFLNNHSPADDIFNGGGAIAIGEYSGPIIESNTFIGNSSLYQGGAIHAAYYFDEIILNNNVFFANSAVRGSALSVTDYYVDDPQVRGSNEIIISNNLFIENHAAEYGVLSQESPQYTVISNCTFSGNDAGSVLGYANGIIVRDCIFWGNTGPVADGTPLITHSLVEGGYPGEGNIDTDPLFVIGPVGGHYLSQITAGQAADSPCVDSGSDSASQICFQLHDVEICLDELTTRTDQTFDSGQADIGYHYAPVSEPVERSIVAGLGPHNANPTTVRLLPPYQDAPHRHEFNAYPVSKYGVNVTCGSVLGEGTEVVLTGPGPGAVFGPHVRGFSADGAQLPGLSFLAYGTNKFGVNVAAGDFDGDGFDEILTAHGPSPAFGAHVRGWNYDGSALAELPGLSFFAWPAGEVRYGARVWAGDDLDFDGRAELIVGSGPGPENGSLVKVYTYQNNEVTLDFTNEAFPSIYTHGVNVAAGRF